MENLRLPVFCPTCKSKRKFNLTMVLALYECLSTYRIDVSESGIKKITFKKCKREKSNEY